MLGSLVKAFRNPLSLLGIVLLCVILLAPSLLASQLTEQLLAQRQVALLLNTSNSYAHLQ